MSWAEVGGVILTNLPAFICFALGLILCIVEMFIPGFGAPGITGVLLLIAGVILKAQTPMEAVGLLLGVVVVLGLTLAISLRSVSRGALFRTPLVLKTASTREAGYSSVEDLAFFLDKKGTAVTILRPAGVGDFEGVRLDVVSEGDFVPAGNPIRVTKVEGRRIVVQAE